MAKKKVETLTDIIAACMKYTPEQGARPKSIYLIVQHLGIKDSSFEEIPC
jgi:hypothetical protein